MQGACDYLDKIHTASEEYTSNCKAIFQKKKKSSKGSGESDSTFKQWVFNDVDTSYVFHDNLLSPLKRYSDFIQHDSKEKILYC